MSSPTGRPLAPQDVAPPGGYPKIRFARNIPHRAISAGMVGLGLALSTTVGIIQLAFVWRERRELKREKMWARLYLLPVFQAEMDREWMKWRASQIQEEKEIMKNVQGWNAGESPYHHQRWVPPTFDLDGNPVRAPVIKWVDSGEPL